MVFNFSIDIYLNVLLRRLLVTIAILMLQKCLVLAESVGRMVVIIMLIVVGCSVAVMMLLVVTAADILLLQIHVRLLEHHFATLRDKSHVYIQIQRCDTRQRANPCQ